MLKKINILLYSSFVILLFVPLVQMIYPFKEVKPLKGAVESLSSPSLSLEGWFEGTFQDQFDKFINDNIGFRPWLVKLHNQIKFSIYGEASARGVIRGKDNYLYELNYIKAYNGDDFLGSQDISNKVKNIRLLQDKLLEVNKTLIVCLAPGKGSFYPQYFPEEMIKAPTDSTNYKVYLRYLEKFQVNHIDMNRWFIEMKDTCNCALYPKYGIHWSQYGMLLAADSLIRYIENARGIQLPQIKMGTIDRSNSPKYSDYDIGEGMNLLFKMKSEKLCYPSFKFVSNENIIKPKTLVISDSFYWSMYNISLGRMVFSYGGFWFYNKQIYPDSYSTPLTVNDIDFAQRMLDNDVVVLMTTDANLPKFSWGFVERALEVLNNPSNTSKQNESKISESRISQIVESIKNNPEWFSLVKKKAEDKNISVDSMLTLDAIWVIEKE